MKRRYADARQDIHLLEKSIKTVKIKNDFFDGYASLLNIIKVDKKACVDIENRCIFDNNYTWLEIYPMDKNYCITVMYDEKGIIKEWYFDIVVANGIEDGVPYEDDLYLDVVIVPDGRIHILDEDELKDALDNNIINKKQFKLAYNTSNYIIKRYSNNLGDLILFTENIKKYFD